LRGLRGIDARQPGIDEECRFNTHSISINVLIPAFIITFKISIQS
jgi:hypothetical protein